VQKDLNVDLRPVAWQVIDDRQQFPLKVKVA
jgi:hypothetical protein